MTVLSLCEIILYTFYTRVYAGRAIAVSFEAAIYIQPRKKVRAAFDGHGRAGHRASTAQRARNSSRD